MNNLLVIVSALFLLQGCASMPPEQTAKVNNAEAAAVVNTRSVSNNEHLYYYIARSSANGEASLGEVGGEFTDHSDQTAAPIIGERSFILSEVVSDMAEQLIINLPATSRHQAIALTSIVDLHDHQVTNWLGQTISEQFIHELHIRNIPIIDFKLTGNIQLTQKGEFALTRDWKRLNKDIDVNRILTGTMSRNDEGVMLNIRIVNANNSLVESTSSAFIPDSMFVGGDYDYQQKKYISRNGTLTDKTMKLVRIVK